MGRLTGKAAPAPADARAQRMEAWAVPLGTSYEVRRSVLLLNVCGCDLSSRCWGCDILLLLCCCVVILCLALAACDCASHTRNGIPEFLHALPRPSPLHRPLKRCSTAPWPSCSRHACSCSTMLRRWSPLPCWRRCWAPSAACPPACSGPHSPCSTRCEAALPTCLAQWACSVDGSAAWVRHGDACNVPGGSSEAGEVAPGALGLCMAV